MLALRFIPLFAILSVMANAAAVFRRYPTQPDNVLASTGSDTTSTQETVLHEHSKLAEAQGHTDLTEGLHKGLVKRANEIAEPLDDVDTVVDTASGTVDGPLIGIHDGLFGAKPVESLAGGVGSVASDIGGSVEGGADKGVAGEAEGIISDEA